MASSLIDLYGQALQTAMILVLPVLGLVTFIGAVTALAQTVVGISDQNLSFLPKIVALAMLIGAGGLPGLMLLEALLRAAISTLPRLAG